MFKTRKDKYIRRLTDSQNILIDLQKDVFWVDGRPGFLIKIINILVAKGDLEALYFFKSKISLKILNNVQSKNQKECTLLQKACFYAVKENDNCGLRLKIVQVLLEEGLSKVSIKCTDPIVIAASHRNIELLDILVKFGLDLNGLWKPSIWFRVSPKILKHLEENSSNVPQEVVDYLRALADDLEK